LSVSRRSQPARGGRERLTEVCRKERAASEAPLSQSSMNLGESKEQTRVSPTLLESLRGCSSTDCRCRRARRIRRTTSLTFGLQRRARARSAATPEWRGRCQADLPLDLKLPAVAEANFFAEQRRRGRGRTRIAAHQQVRIGDGRVEELVGKARWVATWPEKRLSG
jgi:hypothetical protein